MTFDQKMSDQKNPFAFFRSLPVQILVALVLGTALGLIWGPGAKSLGWVGLSVVTLLKTLATPLVFFAVVDAFCKTEIPAKKGVKLIALSTLNALVALIISLSVSTIFPAGKYVNVQKLQESLANGEKWESPANLGKVDGGAFLKNFVPQNILEPFTQNNVIGVVFLAILIGAAIRTFKKRDELKSEIQTIEHLAASGLALVSRVLHWLVRIVPIAVFCIIAKVVGQNGLQVFAALALFVVLVTLGLFIHVCVYYSLLLKIFARKSPIQFFKQGGDALLTAFGVGSSLATLPVTLPTLQEKMKISPSSARLAACVGTNLNHDGILLYEAVAVFFVAQLQGITLGVSQQLTLSLTALLAAVGIAGIPDAGLITLSLVLGAVGLPLTAVPFLLPVDWFIGRLRATANVASDMVVAILLDS